MPRRAQRPKPRRARAYYMVDGFDLRAEMQRLCRIEALGGAGGPLVGRPPELAIRRASKRPRTRMGFAVIDEHRISVTAFPGARRGDLTETLLHELVHVFVGVRPGSRRYHGREFKLTLERAMREAYGLGPIKPAHSLHGIYAEAIERRAA